MKSHEGLSDKLANALRDLYTKKMLKRREGIYDILYKVLSFFLLGIGNAVEGNKTERSANLSSRERRVNKYKIKRLKRLKYIYT